MGNRAVTVEYEQTDNGWKVAVKQDGRTLIATARGLIAAREAAEKLVEKIDPEAVGRHVVHVIDGDAFKFSTAYLHARHGLSIPSPSPAPAAETKPQAFDLSGSIITTGAVITVPAESITISAAPPRSQTPEIQP